MDVAVLASGACWPPSSSPPSSIRHERSASSVFCQRRIVSSSSSCQSHKRMKKRGGVELLHNTLTWAWQDFRAASRSLYRRLAFASHNTLGSPFVVCEIAGQYEDTFDDVDEHLLDYFTYKAVKKVLVELREMNSDQYTWFRDFVVKNKPQDGKLFLRLLVKERQELGERIMETRLHLFNKWVKRYKHDDIKKAIKDQNLELLRERLLQTIKMPSDGDDSESPGPNV